MLRTERIFEPEGIADELGVYNSLVPDGSNLKATLLIEYVTRPSGRRSSRSCAASSAAAGCAARALRTVFATADEDLARENAPRPRRYIPAASNFQRR